MKKKRVPHRDLFPAEYIKDLNATKAAIRCGYSPKTAYSQGSRLLKSVDIHAAIRKLQRKLEVKVNVDAEMVIHELALLALSDIKDYVTIDDNTGVIIAKAFSQMPAGASRAIEAIKEDRAIAENADGSKAVVYDKVTFKLHSKIKALELLGRHLDLFSDDNKRTLILEDQLSMQELKKSLNKFNSDKKEEK